MPPAQLFRFRPTNQTPIVHFPPPTRQHERRPLIFLALAIQSLVCKDHSRPLASLCPQIFHQNGDKEGQHSFPEPLGRGTQMGFGAERHVGQCLSGRQPLVKPLGTKACGIWSPNTCVAMKRLNVRGRKCGLSRAAIADPMAKGGPVNAFRLPKEPQSLLFSFSALGSYQIIHTGGVASLFSGHAMPRAGRSRRTLDTPRTRSSSLDLVPKQSGIDARASKCP